jgi:hypothetical protein
MKLVITLTTFILTVSAVNAENCSCNAFPGNRPIIGLFHESEWGASALLKIPVDPFSEDSVKKGVAICEQWKNYLVKIEICNSDDQ